MAACAHIPPRLASILRADQNLLILSVMADARRYSDSLPLTEEEPSNAGAPTITIILFLESSSSVRQFLGYVRRRAKVQMRLRVSEQQGYRTLSLRPVGVQVRDVVQATMRTSASPHHTPMATDTPNHMSTTVAGTRANIHMGKTHALIRERIRAHVVMPIPHAPIPILHQVTTVELGPRTRGFNHRCNR
jgi:hypothetical protein